jgi:hypothetical protein
MTSFGNDFVKVYIVQSKDSAIVANLWVVKYEWTIQQLDICTVDPHVVNV